MDFFQAFHNVHTEMMTFNYSVMMMRQVNKHVKNNFLKLGYIDTFSIFQDTCLQLCPLFNLTKEKFMIINVDEIDTPLDYLNDY